MLSWLFKKPPPLGAKPAPAKPAAAPKAAPVAKPVAKAAIKSAAELAAERSAAEQEWAAPLQAAMGDDAALLGVAQAAGSPLATKLAAVSALTGEVALRQAERHFRNHDRKVHKLAKQRLEAVVAQREARAKAQGLIAATEALGGEAVVPVNHLVALDRDWAALGVSQLEAVQVSRFAELRAALDARVREAGERQQQVQRWTAQAESVLSDLRTAVATAAAEGAASDLAAPLQLVQETLAACPEAPATAALAQALRAAQAVADGVQQRLQLLQDLQAPVPAAPAVESAAPDAVTAEPEAKEVAAEPARPEVTEAAEPVVTVAEVVEAVEDAVEEAVEEAVEVAPEATEATPQLEAEPQAQTPTDAAPLALAESEPSPAPVAPAAPAAPKPAPPSAVALWQALPAVADAALAQALQQRFDAHQQAVRATAAAAAAAAPARVKAVASPKASPKAQRTPTPEQQQHLDELLQTAEAAQAEGQLTPLQAALQAIDTALEAMPGLVPSARWRHGHQTLLAERARLRGWQQWGGARARDDLADEAEALARFTVVAADPEHKGPKLQIKAHADAIQQLRNRWKELDRLGAVASQSLWQRFDAALHIAYEPVGAQMAVLKAARQQNLADRQALLDTLEALPEGPPAVSLEVGEGTSPDVQGEALHHFWKEQMRALDRFQTAWRQLGPPEHTVPSAARNALMARHRAALDRVAQPLQQARQVAAEQREQLILQVESLLQGNGQANGRGGPNDAPQRVRDLQAQWQHQARQLPLARGVEGALWTRFKAATDAVFAQRDAAFHARDAELAANLAECQALIDRVAALAEVDDNAEIKRTLAEAERLWRQGGELPRGAGPAMEAKYHAARSAAAQRLADSAHRGWQAQCDAAAAALALCQAREQGTADAAEPETHEARWAAVASAGAMPAPWQAALQQRWQREVGSAAASGPLASDALDTVLLQLESALDLHTPPPWQEARRKLKLLALKTAMEGGGAPATGPAQQVQWLATLLAQRGLNEAQQQRLNALLAAVRQGQPLVAPNRS
jgi:hypothetical protein